MKTLTKSELIKMVGDIKGATFVTFVAETKARTIAGCKQEIRKRSKVNGMINFIYENSVNNQREREGKEKDFEAAPRAWGTHETKAIISHKDKTYLNIKVERTVEEPEYFSGGERLQKAIADQLIYRAKESSRQGTEKTTIVRTYEVGNIKRITINGETYDIV